MISPLENMLVADIWGKYTRDIKKLKRWEYWSVFSSALHNLKREVLFTSPVHGLGHIERTMLHGAMAAMDNHLGRHEAWLLLTVCAYHDTGRVSDWLDDAHGKNSAYKLHDITGIEGDDLNMLMAAAEAHSRKDSDMEEVLAEYKLADKDKCRELALLLKDCDGLDRVRISDLDVGFLRHKSAVKRADFARFLFKAYTKEQEKLGLETVKPVDYFHIQLVKDTRDIVHDELLKGKCASLIVAECLGRLLETDVSGCHIPESCKKGFEKHICGAYVGAAAFLDLYLPGDNSDTTNRRREFASAFLKQYRSNICGELRPSRISEGDSPSVCAALTLDTVLFTYKFLCGEN